MKDVQIARRAAVCPGLAFARDAQAHPGVHARGNRHFNRVRSLDPSLPPAFRTAFLDHFSSALARRARARNREETLLIMQLAAALATRARLHARSGLRAGAMAGCAIFKARNFYLGLDAGGGIFERELQVVTQIRAALRARTPAAPASSSAAKNVLKAEDVAKYILKFVENCSEIAGIKALSADSRVAIAVVSRALLGVGKNAVCLGRLAKQMFRLGLILGIAVGVMLQRRFAIGALDLVAGRAAPHGENFVIIFFSARWHLVFPLTLARLH